MRKITSTLLVALAGVGLCAAPVMKGRLDVNGGKIALKPVSGPKGGYFNNIGWGDKAKRKFSLTGETAPLTKGKWGKATFSFIPEADGTVTINLMSNWSKDKGKKGMNAHWIYYDMITSEGSAIKNGDFEDAKNGKPVSWYCSNENYVTSGVEFVSGKAAVKAWHNKRCAQRINVKKGQKVTITVYAKVADYEPAKK